MVVDGANDVRQIYSNAKTVLVMLLTFFQDEEKAKFQKETLPKWISFFEALLGKNKTGFFVGDKVSMAILT